MCAASSFSFPVRNAALVAGGSCHHRWACLAGHRRCRRVGIAHLVVSTIPDLRLLYVSASAWQPPNNAAAAAVIESVVLALRPRFPASWLHDPTNRRVSCCFYICSWSHKRSKPYAKC